jgi:hypothetical protein
MVRLTLLARITDGLPLAEGLDDDQNQDLNHYKMQAKVSSSFCLGNFVSQVPMHLTWTACKKKIANPPCCWSMSYRMRSQLRNLQFSGVEGVGLPLQTLLKQMSAKGAQASRMSVDTGPFSFHYIIEGVVCYLTLTGTLDPSRP